MHMRAKRQSIQPVRISIKCQVVICRYLHLKYTDKSNSKRGEIRSLAHTSPRGLSKWGKEKKHPPLAESLRGDTSIKQIISGDRPGRLGVHSYVRAY